MTLEDDELLLVDAKVVQEDPKICKNEAQSKSPLQRKPENPKSETGFYIFF